MTDIASAPFVHELCLTAENMYRQGWDERNGGNISMLLTEAEAASCGKLPVLRTLPLSFCAKALGGKLLLVTGTGKYFKNVLRAPEENLGLLRITPDGNAAELLWGYCTGGSFTSEMPTHLMVHIERLRQDAAHRVVTHCHPTHLLAMNHVFPLDEAALTHTLWQMYTESIMVFPDGIGVLPWMCCGTNAIGEATAEKMRAFRLVVWALHGIYAAGRSPDETYGLIETVEKAAEIYLLTAQHTRLNTITDAQLTELAEYLHLDFRRDFLTDR